MQGDCMEKLDCQNQAAQTKYKTRLCKCFYETSSEDFDVILVQSIETPVSSERNVNSASYISDASFEYGDPFKLHRWIVHNASCCTV